jgi:osmotically-inducible protein OsmY
VRLYGFTSSDEEKERIEGAIKKVKGVKGIQNEIPFIPEAWEPFNLASRE